MCVCTSCHPPTDNTAILATENDVKLRHKCVDKDGSEGGGLWSSPEFCMVKALSIDSDCLLAVTEARSLLSSGTWAS